MKIFKQVLLVVLIIASVSSCKKDDPEEQEIETRAAFTIKADGTDLLNNESRTYTGIGVDGNMDLRITNTTDSSIFLVIKVVSLTGADGSNIELCLGNCYSSITEGSVYPNGSFEIQGGETTTEGQVHIVNQEGRDGDLEAVFRIYQVDTDNNELNTGTSIEFKYIFDAP